MASAKADGVPVLLSTGVMQRRKGFLKMVQIAEQNLAPNWRFVLSGVFPPEGLSDAERERVRWAMEGRFSSVFVHEGLLSEPEINAEIAASDLVFLGYDDWYQSSNVLTRAAQWRRPVISCSTGVPAERTRRHRLGWMLEHGSVDEIAALLRSIDADTLERQSRLGDYAGLRQQHDVAELPKTFASVLNDHKPNRSVA
ncbi:glycosyltransferase [Crateriforma spongiae]|uniref:glycosyltransferase n=1 Tax=Crateriforma spongiae TaxID=2724528 RepID=UPI0039B0B327